TKTWAWPVSRRFEFLARRVARSRSTAPGRTARVNSSGISRKWPPADIANPTREWRWRRRRAADEDLEDARLKWNQRGRRTRSAPSPLVGGGGEGVVR